MADTFGKNTESKTWGCLNDHLQNCREVQWHYYIAVNYYFGVTNSTLSSLKFFKQIDKILATRK